MRKRNRFEHATVTMCLDSETVLLLDRVSNHSLANVINVNIILSMSIMLCQRGWGGTSLVCGYKWFHKKYQREFILFLIFYI